MSSPRAGDRITIEGLEVACVVGFHEHERLQPQRLVVDVAMTVDAERAASDDQLVYTVDYEWVSTQIAFILKLGRFRLLETAAIAICRALLLAPVDGELRVPIEAVDVVLRKPSALAGRGVPSLRVQRAAGTLRARQESKDFGVVDIIHETPDIGIYRLQLRPAARIGLHCHRQIVEAELMLSPGLYCQGIPAEVGTVLVWPQGFLHGYANPTEKTQSLLRVDRPSFRAADEVLGAAEAEPFVARHIWDL